MKHEIGRITLEVTVFDKDEISFEVETSDDHIVVFTDIQGITDLRDFLDHVLREATEAAA